MKIDENIIFFPDGQSAGCLANTAAQNFLIRAAHKNVDTLEAPLDGGLADNIIKGKLFTGLDDVTVQRLADQPQIGVPCGVIRQLGSIGGKNILKNVIGVKGESMLHKWFDLNTSK